MVDRHRPARAGILTAFALACVGLLGGCDVLDLHRDWSASDTICAERPGQPCEPPKD